MVSPTGNSDPLAGVHVVVTGGWPLATVGLPKDTAAPPLFDACVLCAAGHVILVDPAWAAAVEAASARPGCHNWP